MTTQETTLENLRAETEPIPGKPGQRRDRQGRVWYSSSFLGAPERDEPLAPSAAAIRATVERGAHDA